MNAHPKYLIVGQGLAGSVLAHQFYTHQIDFDIVDDGHQSSASKAAGGIMHPMSFRRLILAWRALELIEYASGFYTQIESDLQSNFFFPATFYRPFGSIEDQNNWMARKNEPPFDQILGITDESISGIDAPYGIGTINYSARLEVNDFLKTTRDFFQAKLKTGVFVHEDLKPSEKNQWIYKDTIYDGVIFCEGFMYHKNPYFSYLPHNFTKGEIIEIQTESIDQKMISKGCFIVPQKGKDNYLVGSTYRWNTLDPSPTIDAKNELVEKVQKVISTPFEVYHQAGGIRPTMTDRKPIIGEHPKHSGLYIFNGMGSKTVMMAPLLANQLIGYLKGSVQIFPEADIARHTTKHFHKFEAYEATKMSKL